MTLSPFLSAVRLVSATLVACAFLIAPMAEAEHVQTQTVKTCDIEHVAEESDEGGADHSEHDHHAHNCGPCLTHLLRRDTVSSYFAQTTMLSIRPPLSEDFASLSPGRLYRPPRA